MKDRFLFRMHKHWQNCIVYLDLLQQYVFPQVEQIDIENNLSEIFPLPHCSWRALNISCSNLWIDKGGSIKWGLKYPNFH